MNHSMHDMGDVITSAPKHQMGPMMNMDMMKMYFHTGVEETVLFYRWKVTTVGGMVGSCIAIFIVAMLYEGLKMLREYLSRKYNISNISQSYNCNNGGQAQESQTVMVDTQSYSRRHRLCNWHHILQTFLHLVQVLVSYLLMLVFMTYNIWLCLAVLLGAATGYFLFGWQRTVIADLNEHCH